jgi:hypothetical protein
LQLDRTYRVIKQFTDYDGKLHPIGEEWVFRGHNFVPYEDGLSMFVETHPGQFFQIRLQWRPESQERIAANLSEYLVETTAQQDA